jgi:hypothetical protein
MSNTRKIKSPDRQCLESQSTAKSELQAMRKKLLEMILRNEAERVERSK